MWKFTTSDCNLKMTDHSEWAARRCSCRQRWGWCCRVLIRSRLDSGNKFILPPFRFLLLRHRFADLASCCSFTLHLVIFPSRFEFRFEIVELKNVIENKICARKNENYEFGSASISQKLCRKFTISSAFNRTGIKSMLGIVMCGAG